MLRTTVLSRSAELDDDVVDGELKARVSQKRVQQGATRGLEAAGQHHNLGLKRIEDSGYRLDRGGRGKPRRASHRPNSVTATGACSETPAPLYHQPAPGPPKIPLPHGPVTANVIPGV